MVRLLPLPTRLLSLSAATLFLAANAASALDLMIDFGVNAPSTTLGPAHASSGGPIADIATTWNSASTSDGVNLADITSLVDASGNPLAGVTLDLGVGTSSAFDWSSQPFVRVGVSGSRSGTGVFANTTFADFMASTNSNGSPTTVGARISGLDAGTYSVWVAVRHTYQNNDNQGGTFAVSAGAGTLTSLASDFTPSNITQFNRANASANTDSWSVGQGFTWETFTFDLTAGQDLVIFSDSTFDNQNGIINAVQIHSIPEPSSFALIGGLGGLALLGLRRKR